MSKDDWERKIRKVTKLDAGDRYSHPPPLVEAMYALEQMKEVHGHTPIETHGIEGFRFIKTFPQGMDRWDKNYEYKIFLKDALLREETALDKTRKLDEHGWLSLEVYAIETTGIKKDIVYKGNLFRESYQGCSKKMGCIIDEGDGEIKIDNECRQKCQNEAAKETGFFTIEELDHIRKVNDTYV